jgi:K+-sensing histidine kinase KdpD
VQEHLNVDRAHVYLPDERTRDLVLRASTNDSRSGPGELGESIPFNHRRNPVARAAREKQLVTTPIGSGRPGAPPRLPGVMIPLVANGELLGILAVQGSRLRRLRQADVDAFTILADHVAIALKNASLFKEAQATIDAMQETSHSKDRVLASASHQLRTLLSTVLGYAELLLMEPAGSLSPAIMADVRALYANGRLLLHPIEIIENALDGGDRTRGDRLDAHS